MISGLDEHVLEVDAVIFGKSLLPLGVDLPVHVEEQVGPKAVEACHIRSESTIKIFFRPRIRFDVGHKGPDKARQILVFHRPHPLIPDRAIWVPVERHSEPLKLCLQIGESITKQHIGPLGLNESRSML